MIKVQDHTNMASILQLDQELSSVYQRNEHEEEDTEQLGNAIHSPIKLKLELIRKEKSQK